MLDLGIWSSPAASPGLPEAASSHPQSSSPAQRELPQKQLFISLYQAAPHSGSFPKAASSHPLSSSPAQRELPQNSRNRFLPPLIEQPRAAGAPLEAGSSLQPRAAAAPTRKSLLPPSIEQPRAAGASPERVFSPLQSNSPAQRADELVSQQKGPSPSLN